MRRLRAGQATVEYAMLISVLFITIFAFITFFMGDNAFTQGSAGLTTKMEAGAVHGYFSDNPDTANDER